MFFQDRKEAAIEDCARAIELKPDYVKALLRRGQAFEDSDRPHEAFKDFEKALEIDPGLKEAKAACMVNEFYEWALLFLWYLILAFNVFKLLILINRKGLSRRT